MTNRFSQSQYPKHSSQAENDKRRKSSDLIKKKQGTHQTKMDEKLTRNLEDNDEMIQPQNNSALINQIELIKQIVNLIYLENNEKLTTPKANSQLQSFLEQLSAYNGEISHQLDAVYTKNFVLKQRFNELEEQNKLIESSINNIHQKVNYNNQNRHKNDKFKSDFPKLGSSKTNLIQKLENINNNIIELNDNNYQLSKNIENLQNNLNNTQNEKEKLSTQIEIIENSVDYIYQNMSKSSQTKLKADKFKSDIQKLGRSKTNLIQNLDAINTNNNGLNQQLININQLNNNLIDQLHTYSMIINMIHKNKRELNQRDTNCEELFRQIDKKHDQILQHLKQNHNDSYIQEFNHLIQNSISQLREINDNNLNLNQHIDNLNKQISGFQNIIQYVYSKRTEKTENTADNSHFRNAIGTIDNQYKESVQQMTTLKDNNLYLNISKFYLEEQINQIKNAVKAIFDNKEKTKMNDKTFNDATGKLKQAMDDLIKELQSVPGHNIRTSEKDEKLKFVQDIISDLGKIKDIMLLSNDQVRIFKFCINYISDKIDKTPKTRGDNIQFANEITGLAKELTESGEQLHSINDKIHKSNDKINLLIGLIKKIDQFKDKDKLAKNELDEFDNLKKEIEVNYNEIIETSTSLRDIKDNVIRLNDGKNQMERYIIHVLTSIRELYSKLDVKGFYDSSSKFEVQVMTNAINIYKNGDTGSSYPSRVDIDGNYSRLSNVQDKLYELTKPIEFSSHFHEENQKIVKEKIEQKDSKYGTNSEINPTDCFRELAECISSLMKDKKDSFTEILHLRKIVRKQMILAKNENELQIDKVRLIQNNEIDAIIRVLT